VISDDWFNLNTKCSLPLCSKFSFFQKYDSHFWWFCLCEALQLLQVTSASCGVYSTLALKGLIKMMKIFENVVKSKFLTKFNYADLKENIILFW